ncbi:uncharacterized protein LOC124647921 [Lolium rigidum]|uniref:uncharacterized protein LOC124647921 n=1 Tax=Lolium rigidum TaxID=89674 RepID=UPI001F5D1485|nr:uncharacterized protein LOC124647921 [Lolium rigidum]
MQQPQPSCKFEEEAKMTGDPLLVLDALVQVFPQVNLSTLIEVSISFKGDLEAAAGYVVHNVLPNIGPDDINADMNEEILEVSADTNSHLLAASVVNGTLSEPSQFDVAAKEDSAGTQDSPMGEHLTQSPSAGLASDLAVLPQESNSPVIAGTQNSVTEHENQQEVMHSSNHHTCGHGDEQVQCSSSETNQGMPVSEDNLALHDDGSHDRNMGSNYSICPESIDHIISAENYNKNALLSNVAAISEMLEEVELSEAETKNVVTEASQAGNDILVEAAKLKEMSTSVVEENNKVAAEVFAEKSVLAAEAQGLQSRLSVISDERNHFVTIIDEMHETLQRRRELAQADRAAAEREMVERETTAKEMLKEQEVLLEAAKEESKRLEQQAQENAKLRELLTDRGHVVDALHGEMLGIFDNIAQLQYRVDMGQLASSTMSSSVESAANKFSPEEPLHFSAPSLPSPVNSAPSRLIYADEPPELAPSSLAGSVPSAPCKLVSVGEPLQLASPNLSSSVKSATSESSWSSATESTSSYNGDEEIAVASPHDKFALDDSWDVVEEEEQCIC